MSRGLAYFQPESCLIEVSSKMLRRLIPPAKFSPSSEGPSFSLLNRESFQKRNWSFLKAYTWVSQIPDHREWSTSGFKSTIWFFVRKSLTPSSFTRKAFHCYSEDWFWAKANWRLTSTSVFFTEKKWVCRTALAFGTSGGTSPRQWSAKSTTYSHTRSDHSELSLQLSGELFAALYVTYSYNLAIHVIERMISRSGESPLKSKWRRGISEPHRNQYFHLWFVLSEFERRNT